MLSYLYNIFAISFHLPMHIYRYCPGDVVMIQPCNTDHNVNEFLNYMKLDGNKKVILQQNDPGRFNLLYLSSLLSLFAFSSLCNFINYIRLDIPLPQLPKEPNIRNLLKYFFDINSIPKRYFFELLSHFSTDEMEKEKLVEFASPEGQVNSECKNPLTNFLIYTPTLYQ